MSDAAGRTVISLGGSLVVPDSVDVAFIRAFKKIIEERITAGEKFVIIVGGGKTCRRYQQVGRDLAPLSEADVDWIGIHTTRFHAEFMRIVFGELAYERVITGQEVIDTEKPIIFGAGEKPGQSTDAVAVALAKQVGAQKVLNLSNTDYVYDKDPHQNPDAKPYRTLSWENYRALIPSEWHPGLNMPFDPIASKEAHELGLEVAIINGRKLDDVRKCFMGEEFDGTVLHV